MYRIQTLLHVEVEECDAVSSVALIVYQLLEVADNPNELHNLHQSIEGHNIILY